jgi:phosphotransferase system enzyme I (PtsI)
MDGERVELHANIELPADAVAAVEAGATGVGLFRSEFLFMNRGGELPSEDEQFEAYRAAVEAMQGMPVTIRTVDIGADKPLDRMSANELRHEHVLNPAMGLRAIRWSLAEPSMFRQQLRAIYRASAYGKLRLLIPMVAHLGEVRQILESIKRVQQQLNESGHAYTKVELGVMIEIPAAAVMLPLLLKHVDFVSIGTNDLIQYTLAIDRADEAVAHLYDPWHPAVLQLIATSIAQARMAGKSVSVCGEMAGDPAFTDLLLSMGLRSFSMHPAQIPSVKQRILRADSAKLAGALPAILASEDPQETARQALGAGGQGAGRTFH